MNKRKSTFRAKLKAFSQEKRLQNWKELFKNLIGNLLKNYLPTWHQTRTVSIGKTWCNTERNKSKKAAGIDEMPPEVWKTRKFDNILLWLCNTVYKQNIIEKWRKGYIIKRLTLWDHPLKRHLALCVKRQGSVSLSDTWCPLNTNIVNF